MLISKQRDRVTRRYEIDILPVNLFTISSKAFPRKRSGRIHLNESGEEMLRKVESRCKGTRPRKDSELERYVTRSPREECSTRSELRNASRC